MTIKSSLIREEIARISKDTLTQRHVWSAELLVIDYPVEIQRIDYINISGDYGSDWQDYITANFRVRPSIYQKLIYPYRGRLKVRLTRALETNGREDINPGMVVQTFNAFLMNPISLVENQTFETISDANLDAGGLMDLPVQLVEEFGEVSRLYQIGGNYRAKAPYVALLGCLSAAIKDNSKYVGEKDIRVDMLEADNKNPREVIPIPHATPLPNIPHLIQDQHGGIYNAGIRMFFRRGCFYIWPKYYLGGKSGNRRTLTIFNLPENQYPHIEKTYRVTDYQVIIVSTGESTRLDQSVEIDLNQGNGIRFTDANAILNGGMVSVENNKAIIRRGNANSEFLDEKTGRAGNLARLIPERVTSNPFAVASRVAARKGIIEQFSWHNANPYLLFPGMEVTVVSYHNGEYIQRKGSLVGASYDMAPFNNNFATRTMITTAGISVFTSKEVKPFG